MPDDSSFNDSAHLTFKDMAVDRLDSPSMVRVHLKQSKMDPFKFGVDIVVGKLRAVEAMLRYLAARGGGPGPLFMFWNNKPLTRSRFVIRVCEALRTMGIDESPYSGHSYRSGAATTAAREGIEDSTIKMLWRWRSSAYHQYIKMPRELLAQVSGRLQNEETVEVNQSVTPIMLIKRKRKK